MKANQSHYQYIAHYGYILNEVNRYVETSIFTGGAETGEGPKSTQFPKFHQRFPAQEEKHTKPGDQSQFGLYIFAQELLYHWGWWNLKFHSY